MKIQLDQTHSVSDEDRMGLEDCEESGLITHRGMSPQPNAKCKLANYVQTNDMWLQ